MYRQAGTTPNFTDIARRYGMNRHTVAKYWKAGGQVEDARRCRPSGLDRHREVIEAKAQLPGATKRGIYEYLIDRCYAGEEPPAYNTLTKWMRRNGIECGRPPEGPEPHPRFETAPGEQMQFDWKESLRMADADGEVFEGEYLFGAVCNSTSIAGLMKLSPDAVDLCDGQFELMLVPVPKTPLQLQRTIRAIVYEEYETSNALIFRHVRHVTAESDGSIPWTLDGEYAPGVPKIEIGIEDNGIQMMI